MDEPLVRTHQPASQNSAAEKWVEGGAPPQVKPSEGRLPDAPATQPRLRMADLPRRQALLNCTPNELVATTWEWNGNL